MFGLMGKKSFGPLNVAFPPLDFLVGLSQSLCVRDKALSGVEVEELGVLQTPYPVLLEDYTTTAN